MLEMTKKTQSEYLQLVWTSMNDGIMLRELWFYESVAQALLMVIEMIGSDRIAFPDGEKESDYWSA